jgi:hypothetical protein
MPHNTTDKDQTDRENRLWIASQDYVTGEIDIDELEAIEKDYTEALNHAIIVISKRNLYYNFLAKLRKFLKPKPHHNKNLPLSYPYVQ